MAKQKSPQPTDGELEVLRFLWDNGPSTVKQVHKTINQKKAVKYTTTLKVMQVMHERGLLRRDDSHYRHIYQPAQSEEKTQGQLLTAFLDKAFSGSAEKLVMQLLSAKKLSDRQRQTIIEMFNDIERK